MKNFYPVVLGLLLGATGVIAAERPAATVAVETVKRVDSVINRKYMGAITGIYDVGLVPRVSGVIQEQKFNNGDFVKKDQLLFVIEDTTYRAKRDAAKAKLAQCESEYHFAKLNLDRTATLRKQNAVSESSYDDAVRLESTCAAAVAAAKAELLEAENNLGYTRISSPIDGRAGKAAVSPKNYVTPSTGTLLTVVSLDPVYLDFSISSRDFFTMFGSFENVKKYADVTLDLADGTPYPEKAEICFMDNRVDKDTDTIRLRGRVKNPDHKLIPDSLVTVHVARRSDGTAAGISPAAVLNDGHADYVYVLDKNNRAVRCPVIPGELSGDVQVIKTGLVPGEVVIVDGTHKVMPNDVVRPVHKEK